MGELLDAFPHLESVLIEIAPAFEKLRNPILRKTVAKVATLQQAAAIGNLKVDELVNRLRLAAGIAADAVSADDLAYLVDTPPEWFDARAVVYSFDATEMINSGGSPMAEVLGTVKKLIGDDIYELKTPFVPAPLLDMLKEQGYEVFAIQNNLCVLSYVRMKG